MDALSAWFVLIINFTCVNGALYGIGYMKTYREQKSNLALHWSMFLLFQASMLWVCMLQHGLAFLIAWELMSLSSLLLVMFEHQKKETLKAGMNYMVQMHVGVVLLTAAFIWVYVSKGSFDFGAIGSFFKENTNAWLFLLFFGGFGIKAGFIPLHSWLPHAHPAAPSHVSGVMSGVIVKMGIYGILRVALMLENDWLRIGASLLVLSVATGLYGILNAAMRRDFKMMLAYCTIENIGIIGAGTGLFLIGKGTDNPTLSTIGLAAALLHTLNHSLYKSLLFFSAGSVYQQTHTRDMEKLGGLIRKMPQTAFFFLMGALAIGGLPPLNGFVSEFLLYFGFLAGLKTSSFYLSTLMMLSLAGLAVIGGISLLAFTKSFGVIFLGNPRQPFPHEPTEVPLVMRLPQFLIVAVMLSVGLFPQFYLDLAMNVAGLSGLATEAPALVSLKSAMANAGRYSMVFLVLLLPVFFIRNVNMVNRPSAITTTWGCGYPDSHRDFPNSRMQYTGKSFSKTLGKLLGFLVGEKKQYEEISPTEIFPKERSYVSHYADFFEKSVIEKLTKPLLKGMNYFEFIQNGRIQYYVLYGVFFILLLFLGTVLNWI
ncbi:MAG: NADH-quinone oxidoreductase subunit E [Bacteroidetes bacterium]|nr:NADH-quinone oxidoreductase subunit E [Bacteroidota bacterium]